ncbi:CGNR zinc finger domain-containing protein [Paenibacillus graminis]|uniref:CGNR zinc finger domain-containing protein n=1 Tax=Paenibacillus graminis TaxID=189425 RepID=UPI002DBDE448|nr:CGNR zinc finger domain-containing protein [Paenibacillus graminis]MEC0172330.1 CGNR zinc finger domain-containing protein [Paenibacillus graminis]
MLWDDFINSYWRDWRTGDRSKDKDKLQDQEWLAAWLEQHSLRAELPVTPKKLEQLQQLRSLLREAVQKLVKGYPLDRDLLERLNGYMLTGPVIRQVAWNADGKAEISFLPQRSDWEQVMAEIASSFAAALVEKETSRFRICENPDCLWVYYDDTRNRSKRYCDDKLCGNLMKVRRFRARKKADMEENF